MKGNRIEQIRNELGLTQKEFGAKLGGFSDSSVSMWESGNRNPSLKILKRIASMCGVSIDYLIGASDKKGTYVENKEVLSEEKIDIINKQIDMAVNFLSIFLNDNTIPQEYKDKMFNKTCKLFKEYNENRP